MLEVSNQFLIPMQIWNGSSSMWDLLRMRLMTNYWRVYSLGLSMLETIVLYYRQASTESLYHFFIPDPHGAFEYESTLSFFEHFAGRSS